MGTSSIRIALFFPLGVGKDRCVLFPNLHVIYNNNICPQLTPDITNSQFNVSASLNYRICINIFSSVVIKAILNKTSKTMLNSADPSLTGSPSAIYSNKEFVRTKLGVKRARSHGIE